MGRMLETLRQAGAKRGIPQEPVRSAPPAPAAETEPEDVPFIEVGGKQAPVEGSPEVLASLAPRPAGEPQESPGISVCYAACGFAPGSPGRKRF